MKERCECGNALTVGTVHAGECGQCPTVVDAEYWHERTKYLIKKRDDELRRKALAKEQWLSGRRF